MGKLIIPKATSTERLTITPDAGELIFDETSNKTYEGDGATVGGKILGSGEENTNSDAGTSSDGEGLVNTKVGVDTPIKRIKGGTGITVSSETNDLVITNSSTGPAEFVKSTSINGSTSVSFVDQDDATTTFTPAGGGGSGSGVTFLSTQAEYDSQVWSAGDIFIPTDSGISVTQATSLAATINMELTSTSSFGATLNSIYGNTDFFATSDSSVVNLEPRSITFTPLGLVMFATNIQARINPTGKTLTQQATELTTLLNTISKSGTVIGSATITRQCTITSSGSIITFTNDSTLSTVEAGAISGCTVTIFAGENAETLTFVENRQYVRRSANDGWLVFTTATQDFIET